MTLNKSLCTLAWFAGENV